MSSKKKKKKWGMPAKAEEEPGRYCTKEICGDCCYYRTLGGIFCCHFTYETGIIRKGPITKDCVYKRIATPEERHRMTRRQQDIYYADPDKLYW